MTSTHRKELFEERAGIMQFDGKMTKAEAERAAEEDQLKVLQEEINNRG